MGQDTKDGKLRKPGTGFTKKVTRGPNKGDTVRFRVARGGKPYPVKVVKDVGGDSTLKNNPGVALPGEKAPKKRSVRSRRGNPPG